MKKPYRPLNLFLMTLALNWCSGLLLSAHAQSPTPSPTILESESSAQRLFDGLERGFKGFRPLLLQFGTQCTQRAHAWSYELDRVHQVITQKIFVFYTHAYQDFYVQKHGKRFKWWFHVSPFVLVKTATDQVEERTLDASFSDRPLSIQDWTDIFVESGKKCVENVPFADFEGDVTSEGRSHDASAHCYVIRAPMVDMFPLNVDARQKSQHHRDEWDLSQVFHAAQAMTASAKREYLRRVGLR
jgi:hypothetical protein